MKFFSPELRTASVVPRWSVVWTLTRDVLSNHSFFVALYADQIAELIEWEFRYSKWLVWTALTHDLDETITGDITAPSKREILDTGRAEQYIDRNMKKRLPLIVEQMEWLHSNDPTQYHEAKLIVKVADRLDALLFLTVEKRLGNSVIAPRIPECQESLIEAWNKLPVSMFTLAEKWPVVFNAVKAHEVTGGYGI